MTPAPRLVHWGAGLAAAALPVPWFPDLTAVWLVAAAALFMVALSDLRGLLRTRSPALRRELRHSIPVGVWSEVALHLENPHPQPLRLLVHDFHPVDFAVEQLPQELTIPPDRAARLVYKVRPERRGDHRFDGCDLILDSPLGLWRRKRHIDLADEVKVFPNFREITHFALLATDNRLSQMGVRRHRRRGEGNDFHQLREYRTGDSLRQIDWNATSRYQKLISKEYQDERDQQVLFLLDCGRRMRHAEAGRVHLDEALNAMLLLAYVAVRQGDAVGFMAFGGPHRWFPPRKSAGVVRELLDQTYDLDSTTEAADYLMAARELMPLQRRRALVVLLTNTRDEDRQELVQAVRLLARRHLVVVADLRESLLDEALEARVHDIDSALQFHAVHDYLQSRRRSHEKLQHQGAYILDLLAPQLPAALVNQYLEIKGAGVL